MMNMSMSGQAYIGVDIGGFGGDSTPELLTKWAIASLFNPLYRNHSSLNTKRQEPYLLHDEYLAAYKKAVEVRYEILPTLYDQLFLAESGGSIPIRPLIYNYPDDPRLINENTEVMLGDSLLLAPSLFPGESKRNCYFPAEFLDVFTGKAYKKGDHVISVGTTDISLFLAKNGIAVLSSPGDRKAERGDVLRLLWGGGEAKAYHFEDEGDGLGYKKGEYNLYLIEASEEKGVSLTPLHQGFESRYKKIIIDIPGGAHLEEDLA